MSEELRKMYAYQNIQQPKNEESICHSASIRCQYGRDSCILNLAMSHGKYVGNCAQIDIKDGKDLNFGYCNMIKGLCKASPSDWINGNKDDLMFDERTLSMQESVPLNTGFMWCRRGGIIEAENSGQGFSKPRNMRELGRVFITDDNRYIVVDGIEFEIYSPITTATIVPVEKWYELDTWKAGKVDFDALGVAKEIRDSLFKIGDYEMPERKEVKTHHQQKVQSEYPETKYGIKDFNYKWGAALGIQLAVDILRAIANAIEYTYVKFVFEKSDLNRYRVVITGGTKNETVKFQEYDYYERDKSYIFDVVPDMFDIKTITEIQKEGYDLIRSLVNNIKEGKSRAELLVPDDQLGLSGNEYYDLHCRLNKERRYNSYQTYIYTDSDGKICQKPIIYSGDQFRIVKRDPGFLYYLGETIDLIELIPDMVIKDIDKDNSNLFWKLFEKVLIKYNNEKEPTSMKELSLKIPGIPKASPANAEN